MKKAAVLVGIACLALLSLVACGQPLELSVDFAATQPDQSAPPWLFQLYFDSPVPGLNPSYGPTSGATIVAVNVRTNRTAYITGARIEDVRYEPASTYIDYVHPTLGEISPIFASLPTSYEYSGGYGALEMNPNVDNIFEVNLSSELSLWDSVDFDANGTTFPTDTTEVITLRCNMFLEGFLPDGTEFSGSYPIPLNLDIRLSHPVS